MADTLEQLIVDLLEWLETRERTYEEALDAWRTSCPRFPVWEDANDRGLVESAPENGRLMVRVTPKGRALLTARQDRAASRT
jgi:D-3-phosphoglycerate dehydrogenase